MVPIISWATPSPTVRSVASSTVTGRQLLVQASTHAIVPSSSNTYKYTLMPFAETRCCPQSSDDAMLRVGDVPSCATTMARDSPTRTVAATLTRLNLLVNIASSSTRSRVLALLTRAVVLEPGISTSSTSSTEVTKASVAWCGSARCGSGGAGRWRVVQPTDISDVNQGQMPLARIRVHVRLMRDSSAIWDVLLMQRFGADGSSGTDDGNGERRL